MRLQNLQLVRYGKFTETDIALPKSTHDFHLIVGPNEAGKSTLRGAIADLLFGFPARANAMAFLHPQPDLRLAAQIANDGAVLDFARVKAAKNTLRSAADAVLADDALVEFLGAADRKFFESMFGLGHMQLVEGGQSILDASKEVSQVLFQSAAGIAGLGKVKDALLVEAGTLWGPRHSANRSYYAAHEQCEEASRALKAATVRTKAWADASKEFDEVEARIATAKAHKAQLQTRRGKLERVRRLAPAVQELRSAQADLQALGEVLDLPANASDILETGESELSVAQTMLRHCSLDVQQFTQQREDAVYDAEMLALKSDVEDLAALGERVRNHYADLVTQQAQLERSVLLAQTAGAELGWPQDAAGLRSKLSLAVGLREVQRLVAEYGGLKETAEAAAKAAVAKQEELDAVAAELEEAVCSEVPPALRGAISEAQASKNTLATQAKLASAVQAAQRNLEAALAGLGAWRRDVQALSSMSIPSTERLAGLLAKRQALEAEHAAGVGRAEEAQAEFDSAQLACKQFAEASRVVTGQEVRQARDSRDAKWQSIKTGQTALESGAAGLESAIALADELVDSQLGSATEAAQLQSLRQRAQRAQVDLQTRQRASERKAAELAALDQEWQVLSAGLQLSELALADAQAWMNRREQALQAANLLEEKQAQWQDEVAQAQVATAALQAQLLQAGAQVVEGSGLPVLLAQAEALISAADQANARRMQLQKQGSAAKAALARLQAASELAQAAYREWQVRWSAAVEAAALSDYVKTVADAEQAILRVEQVRQNLDKADATQRDRIDTMKHDLAEFASRAEELLKARGAAALEQADARQVVREFSQQLKEAEAGFARRTTAENALSAAQKKLADADKEVERIQAKLAPLLAAAGVSTLVEAAPLIERSNCKRQWATQMAQTREFLVQGSDGLGLETVMEEVQTLELEQVAAELSETEDLLEQVQVQLTQLAEERLRAEQAVQAIGGGNDAAAAEARRQEALAGMADASDRYIKVTTAAKLLTWAIDRYREQNQGPMLARAGAIFAGLTLGQYSKLFVDYAKTPLSLSALRANGKVVEVSGLSEGTRDQLYLALRLAGLELHLAQSPALPFVADDLFINFDDERSTAGLEALRELSTRTQVLFLSHHEHLLARVQKVFGESVNVVRMER